MLLLLLLLALDLAVDDDAVDLFEEPSKEFDVEEVDSFLYLGMRPILEESSPLFVLALFDSGSLLSSCLLAVLLTDPESEKGSGFEELALLLIADFSLSLSFLWAPLLDEDEDLEPSLSLRLVSRLRSFFKWVGIVSVPWRNPCISFSCFSLYFF